VTSKAKHGEKGHFIPRNPAYVPNAEKGSIDEAEEDANLLVGRPACAVGLPCEAYLLEHIPAR
jgi:hypothetical protein